MLGFGACPKWVKRSAEAVTVERTVQRRMPSLPTMPWQGDRRCKFRRAVALIGPATPPTAICSGLPVPRGPAILSRMGTKSRETIYGASIRAAAERATEARKEADRLAIQAWNKRMLGFQGPAQPTPTLGDAINAGYGYLEVKCLGCNTHQTVALHIVRRPKATPVHELERYMRCRQCSEIRGYAYKRSHLVALRAAKISASDPPSTWPGER